MIDLLYLFSERDNYNKYERFIKENVLTKETKVVFEDLKEWYDSVTTADHVDWAAFATWFRTVKHPMFKEEKLELFQHIFDAVPAHVPDSEVQDKLIESLVAKDYATRIYLVAQDVAEGMKGADEIIAIDELLEDYRTATGDVSGMDKHTSEFDIDTIMDRIVGKGGLQWRLKCMQENVGPIRKGNFIIVGARPDSGKTTFLASEVTHMAAQLEDDQQVLWFNNEEDGEVVKSRILQAATGLTLEDIETDRASAMREYEAALGRPDRIKLFDKATLSVRDIHEALARHNVGLIVFDQLRKVKGFVKESGKSDVLRLELLYNQGREWAKEFAPVITVHQASSAATGVLYPNMDMLHQSQTGIQGEADLIVMIGRSFEVGYEMTRGISIPKNKLPPQLHAPTRNRNMTTQVEIKPEIARFTDPEEV